MIKLDQRHEAQERMDAPCLDSGIFDETYRQIRSLNVCTLGYWPTMRAVEYFLRRCGRCRKISILDIGCGEGETLRRIARYGLLRNIPLKLTGIDINPAAIVTARAESSGEDSRSIEYFCADALSLNCDEDYDFIINSLTLHHLNTRDIVTFIRWMTGHAAAGWFICDLHRHPIAYHFIKYFVRLGRFNPMVCHDAPLSVARGFRRRDWVDFLTQAGLPLNEVDISWYPNFRYGIRYERPL